MPHSSHQSVQSASTSRRYPRYLSFSPGELETQLRELNRLQSTGQLESTALESVVSQSIPIPLQQSSQGTQNSVGGIVVTSDRSGSNRSKLLKSHSCSVRFPDGREGCCHYTRGGPTWHLFRFDYVEAEEEGIVGTDRADGTDGTKTSTLRAVSLPIQYERKRLENDVASIELAAREKAAAAFREAIERERQEYFRRAAETAFRKKRLHRFQMKAYRAKQLAGKYAVCQFIGPPAAKRLLPVGPAYDRLEDANREWQLLQGTRPLLVVACCNRLDRCWEIPRFNPLYAVFDPRKNTAAVSASSMASTPRPHPDDDSDDWEFLPGPDAPDEDEDSEDEDDVDCDREGDDA